MPRIKTKSPADAEASVRAYLSRRAATERVVAAETAARLDGRKNPFEYMLTPATVAELRGLGIRFTSIESSGLYAREVGQDDWPMLVLPSGATLSISQGDEGNGPGVIIEEAGRATRHVTPSLTQRAQRTQRRAEEKIFSAFLCVRPLRSLR